jgi:hypothetical protein
MNKALTINDLELVQISRTSHSDEIVTMSDDDISTFPLRARFRTIANIRDRVINLSPAPKYDPQRPVDEDRFPNEIAALIKISETMRHSRAYKQWLDLCRTYLTIKLYENNMYMGFLKKWDRADVVTKQGVHKIRERLHTEAANETFKPIFTNARVTFFTKPKRKDPIPERRTVRNGQFFGNIETRDPKRRVDLNMHIDSTFSNVAKSSGTGHHEKVHDLGFQLGWLYSEGRGEELENQIHDGMLWYALKKEQATISPRIRSAYRAQFHEVVAFSEGDKMAEITRQMLRPNFIPPTPPALS